MAQGTFVVSAQNKIKEGLDAAKKDLLGFEDAAKKVGDTLKTALTVTAIAAGLKKLGEAAFDCYTEFGEMDRRMRQLKIALDNNDASFRRNIDLIERMGRSTLASKDDIENLVSELASLGKSDKEIEAITTAAVNLSNVTGKDLNSAFTLINATYAGTTGRLTQLLPEIGNLSKEQLAAGEATKIINDRFTTLSQTLAADNIPQKMKNLQTSFGDLKENIGELTAGVFSGFTDQLQTFLDGLNNAFGQYKSFLAAKNALTAEDKARALLDQKKYIQEEQRAAQLLANKEIERVQGFVLRQNPALKYDPQQLRRVTDQAIGNDAGASYASGALVAVNIRLANVDKQLADIKATTGIDFAAKFTADALKPRTTTTGGAPLASGTASTAKPLTDAELAAKFGPQMTGPLSSGGYIFGKQFYEQFGRAIGEFGKEARDDLESYGWSSDMLIKPWQDLRDDLESYGWEGLGKSTAQLFFEGWAGVQGKYNPDEPTTGFSFTDGRLPAWKEFENWADSIAAIPPPDEGVVDEAAARLRVFNQEFQDWSKYIGKMEAPEEGAGVSMFFDTSSPARRNFSNFAEAISGDFRDDLESYGWSSDMLTKPFEDFRDDLESYGWEGLGKSAAQQIFEGWADEISKGLKPEESEGGISLFFDFAAGAQRDFWNFATKAGKEARDDLESYGWDSDMLVKPFQDLRDDLESYGWDGLGKSMAQQMFEGWAAAQSLYNPDNPQANLNLAATAPKLEGMSALLNQIKLFMGGDSAAFGANLAPLMQAVEPLIGSLGIFGQALTSAAGPLIILLPVIEGIVSVLGPAIGAVIKPVLDALFAQGQILGQMLLPVLDAIAPIFALLGHIMMTVVVPTFQILAPFIQATVLMLQMLAPVLGIVAKAFTILMSPVQFIADLFGWLGKVIQTFAWNISHPFNQKNGPGKFTSDAFTGLNDRLKAIDTITTNSQSLQTGAVATTASQSASYRVQQITINIYQQAPVVGSGGMDEFVSMIRDKFGELEYFGTQAVGAYS